MKNAKRVPARKRVRFHCVVKEEETIACAKGGKSAIYPIAGQWAAVFPMALKKRKNMKIGRDIIRRKKLSSFFSFFVERKVAIRTMIPIKKRGVITAACVAKKRRNEETCGEIGLGEPRLVKLRAKFAQ